MYRGNSVPNHDSGNMSNGRGGGSGRMGSGNRRSGPVVFRGPKASFKPQANLPTPQHLSKTSSAESNDPLCKEAFICDPSMDLRRKPEMIEFTPSCVGFTAVVDQTYVAMVSADNNFGRRVPESAFAYYCALGLWAKLLTVHQKNGKVLTFDELRFVEEIQRLNPQYPSIIASYMNAFGNFSGVDKGIYDMVLFARPETITEDGVVGWWEVDEMSHVFYENFVHPSVCALRVLKDMAMAPGVNPQWDLPAGIMPDDWGQFASGHPTTNLLGWKPAVALRAEALQLLEGARLSLNPHRFPSDNASISMNMTLISRIMEFVQRTTIFGLTEINFGVDGSGGQATWVEPARGEEYIAGSGKTQVTETLVQKSPWGIDGRVSNGAAVLLLRFKRRIEERTNVERLANAAAIAAGNLLPAFAPTANNWCCFEWDDYNHVPDEWIETGNAAYEGCPVQLQNWMFWSAQYMQEPRVKVTVRAFEISRG